MHAMIGCVPDDGTVPFPGAEPAPKPERDQWVDIAKGGAIVLVLLHHTWEIVATHRQVFALWGVLDQALAAMRMPTFFMISGLFAAKVVHGSFAQVKHRKLVFFGYVYAIWSAFYTAFYAAKAALEGRPVLEVARQNAIQALTMNSKLWYLPAVAIFFGLAYALRRLPAAVQLALAAATLVPFALRLVESGSWGVDRMAQYFFWFLVGCHGSTRIRRAAERSNWPIVAGLALAWMTAGAAMLKVLGRGWHFGDLVLPLLAVPLAVAASGVIARWAITRPLAALGRVTLPVYVLHDAVIVLTMVVLPSFGRVFTLPLITIFATSGCVLVSRMLRRQRYLFSPPVPRPSRVVT